MRILPKLARYRRELRGKYIVNRHVRQEFASLKSDMPSVQVPPFKLKTIQMIGLGGPKDVELARRGDVVEITFHPNMASQSRLVMWRTLISTLYWYLHCPTDAKPITVNNSDGDVASLARFSPSSCLSDVIPIPDYYFFSHRGYQRFGELAAEQGLDWNARSDDIVWRGRLYGCSYFNYHPEMAQNPGVSQRVRMAHLTKGTEVDFKFVTGAWHDEVFNVVAHHGLAGGYIDESSWVNRKYAIDIDGVTNAWSNLFIRMKLGCCVFKVESDFGYRQWYYDKLVPFEHYIPIRKNLTDLWERIEWAKTHPKEARDIAMNGKALADSMTWDVVRDQAVEIMTNHV